MRHFANERTTMQHPTRLARIRSSRAIGVASLLALATITVVPPSLGAASFVQTCVAPLPSAQSGRQNITPGINGLATAQKVTSKVNLFQCTDLKKTAPS